MEKLINTDTLTQTWCCCFSLCIVLLHKICCQRKKSSDNIVCLFFLQMDLFSVDNWNLNFCSCNRCLLNCLRVSVENDEMSPSAGSSQRGPGGGWAGEVGEGPGEPGQGSGPQDGRQTQSDWPSSGVDPGQWTEATSQWCNSVVMLAHSTKQEPSSRSLACDGGSCLTSQSLMMYCQNVTVWEGKNTGNTKTKNLQHADTVSSGSVEM